MNVLNRWRLICHPESFRLFVLTHRLFRKDRRYSPLNLIKALWFAVKEDKIVRHDGTWIYSSFLPPIP